MARDFLDEIVAERTARNPDFPRLLAEAEERRARFRSLAQRRQELGLSQTAVAARMGTSQSVVARIESGEVDTKLSTIERYAAALGMKLSWSLCESASETPRAV